MKCMVDRKENSHWDLGSERINVNSRVLEKSIWVLGKSWKSPGNLFLKKGRNPVVTLWKVMTHGMWSVSVVQYYMYINIIFLMSWQVSQHLWTQSVPGHVERRLPSVLPGAVQPNGEAETGHTKFRSRFWSFWSAFTGGWTWETWSTKASSYNSRSC